MRRSFVALTLAAAGCLGIDPAASPTPAPLRGGTVTVAITRPGPLDPARAVYPATILTRVLCEPLVGTDPNDGALRSGAATSWRIEKRGRRIVFELRRDLTFHHGRAVVASDYVFSMSRFVRASKRRFWLERVEGFADVAAGRAQTLRGVRAHGRYRLVINLSKPFAELPAILSHPAPGAAVPRETVGKGRRPACAGPYEIEGRPGPKEVTLARVGRGERGPFPKRLRFVFVSDRGAGYRLVRSGRADLSEVPAALLGAARQAGGLRPAPDGLVSYLGLPVRRPPFNDVLFRRSLSLGLGRRKIVDGLLGGSRMVATGFLPGAGGPAARASDCPETMPGIPRPQEARKALTASKTPPRQLSFPLHFNDNSSHRPWLRQVASHWRTSLGVRATLEPREYKRYLDMLADLRARGPFRFAWPVEFPSPEAMVAPFERGSPDNFTGYSSRKFQSAIASARETVDPSKRRDLYITALKRLCTDVPAMVVWFGTRHFSFSRRVFAENGAYISVWGEPSLRTLWVSRDTV